MLQIYDSLSQQKKPFQPMEPGKVRMYVCGPTVYDYCHIGNARTFTAFDVVYRYLLARGYDVRYVRNITDVDDKIIQRAEQNNESCEAVTQRYTDILLEDFKALGLLEPTHQPRATEWIDEMIILISRIIAHDCAYITSAGDVYFSVKDYAKYGQLSHQDLTQLQHGVRVDVAEDKRDPLDFALWKAAKKGEPAWESPWGSGRPGWHIECSAMSTALLGNTLDIHGGGYDLTFPHHENERAQSEAVCHQTFVNYWMHAGFLNINQEKMSKSLNNFFTLREVLAKNDAEVVRYFLLASHYRSQVSYSEDTLANAAAALTRLYTALKGIDIPESAGIDETFVARFYEAMDDDFNTPVAVAVLFDLAKEINKCRVTVDDEPVTVGGEPVVIEEEPQEKLAVLAATLKYLGKILGILQREPTLFLQGVVTDAAEIEAKIAERNAARARKDWAAADKVRDELAARGIVLEDAAGVTSWRRG